MRISKKARLSNWAAPQLTPDQIAYAATDAWISRELYLRFERGGCVRRIPAVAGSV
jgi:ribonuclease D